MGAGFFDILLGVVVVGVPLVIIIFAVVSSRKKQRGKKRWEPYQRELEHGGALRPETFPADATTEHRSLSPRWKPPQSVAEWEERGDEVEQWLREREGDVIDPYSPSLSTTKVRELYEEYCRKERSGSSDGQSNPPVRDKSGVRLPSGAPVLTKKTRWYTKYASTQHGPYKTASEMVREVKGKLFNTEATLPIVIGESPDTLIQIGTFNPFSMTYARMHPIPYLDWHLEKKEKSTWC